MLWSVGIASHQREIAWRDNSCTASRRDNRSDEATSRLAGFERQIEPARTVPMIRYIIRRLLFAVPTLIAISFIVFALLDLAPNDPTGQLPLTIPPEVRAQIRESLGLGQPFHVRYFKWAEQFFINEPLNIVEQAFGVEIGDSSERLRVRSWATRSPVVDLIVERMPQTLWVVGLSYIVGILVAIPIGIISAYRQYSWFDQVGTFVSMVGFSVPTFFTGLLAIIIFSVMLQWLPSIYDTTHRVTDLASFWVHLKQLVMPVLVLDLYHAPTQFLATSYGYDIQNRRVALQLRAQGSFRRLFCGSLPVRGRCPGHRRWPVGAVRRGWPCAHATSRRRRVGRWR